MLLLDTHVVIWFYAADPALSLDVAVEIETERDVFVSAATIWELAIKEANGKLRAPTDLPERIESGFRVLPITAQHAAAAARLPPIHRDPFDRMLIAQALTEGLTLMTRDRMIARYDVPVVDPTGVPAAAPH